jgi:hypothetical protein
MQIQGLETRPMILELSKIKAMKLMLALPERRPGENEPELSVRSDDPHVWLGLGWMVGDGLAQYRGDYQFRFAPGGRASSRRYIEAVEAQ